MTRFRALLASSLATVSLALVAPRLVEVTLAAETQTGRIVVRPADHGRALVNPGRGFVLHHYDNSLVQHGSRLAPSDPLDDFPGLSTVYLRLAWSYVEPEEGRFDWSIVDSPAPFSASEGDPGVGTPLWVRAGAPGATGASSAIGTPTVSSSHDGDDGLRRVRIGQVRVLPPGAPR